MRQIFEVSAYALTSFGGPAVVIKRRRGPLLKGECPTPLCPPLVRGELKGGLVESGLFLLFKRNLIKKGGVKDGRRKSDWLFQFG
jgi:hypothetical protein